VLMYSVPIVFCDTNIDRINCNFSAGRENFSPHGFFLSHDYVQCSPANPAQAGEEAVGLAALSGLPSSSCVLVGK